jgi:TPR repeat protein
VEEEDDDGKESTSASTATSLPSPTYVENLTCCVCMDDLQVDVATFTRLTCCGQAMDKECWAKFQNSTMPEAQKSVCPQCRQEFPTSTEGNVKQVREWVDKSKAWAQTNLADKYHFGKGVPQSYEEAIEYLNMAIKQGDPNAMFQLAAMYENGHGVAQSLKKAAELYALAANQGHATAQSNLGFLYINGQGVAQSNDMARKWWLKAALQELEPAINNLKQLDQLEGKTTPTLPCCAACGTPKTTRRPLNICSGCRTVHYCNRECQMTHWREGHKRECKRLQKEHTTKLAAAREGEK